jgi:hypothetical protein
MNIDHSQGEGAEDSRRCIGFEGNIKGDRRADRGGAYAVLCGTALSTMENEEGLG